MKRTFKRFLLEAPIQDYKTYGDFSKSSSFRNKTDRYLVSNPKVISYTKKAFSKTEHTFNLYFVNSKYANEHTEVGEVDLKWVHDNLPDEKLIDDIAKNIDNDSINIIFTNNKGVERIPMTAWMMAHRIMHAVARKGGSRPSWSVYKEAADHIASATAHLLQYYNVKDYPSNDGRLTRADRNKQLLFLRFWEQICTFKSARDRNLRDWFEIMNELGAQYIITGELKFNKAPSNITQKGYKNTFSYSISPEDKEEVDDYLEMLPRDLKYMFESIFGNAMNKIYVM
jgi:hypothetical protein